LRHRGSRISLHATRSGDGSRNSVLFRDANCVAEYRLQVPGFELPEAVRLAQQEFDDQLAAAIAGMADRMEGKPPERKDSLEQSFEQLEHTIQTCCSGGLQETLPAEVQTFLALSRGIERVTASLDREI
jgi:hypothetical protein